MIVGRRHLTMAAVVATVAIIALAAHIGASGTPRSASPVRAASAETQALFGFDAPTDGPFPSDWFTVPDHTNLTHRRVSLPTAGCAPSDCEDLAVLNDLDGFNLRPRLSVPFNGPIDPTTVNSDTMFLVSLGITGPGQDYMPSGTVVGIDQVVWDTFSNTLHVESDQLLAQHTRFALIVTRGIRDQNGVAIGAPASFRGFRADVREDYKQDLLDAIQAARAAGVSERDIAVASVFTTQSATAVLEKIRDQIHAATPDPANFLLGQNGERTVFDLPGVTSIMWTQAAGKPPTPVSLSAVRTTFPGAVGVVAFGKYESPDYLVHPYQYMPRIGTRTGVPQVQGPPAEIYFNLFLPSGPKPSGGWPVAIFGHGVNGNKNVQPLSVAATMAHYGIATIAINMVGHGLGADGTLTVVRPGGSVTFPAGGRGFDQNGDHKIDNSEGSNASGDRALVISSDAFRQTAADLMQLVRVIADGMDVDADGQPDLNPTQVYYFGNSWGAALGTVFLGVEPSVRVAALSVPADTVPISFLGVYRTRAAGPFLQARQPSRLNSPGISDFGGLTLTPPLFDDNMPLRGGLSLGVGLEDSTTRTIKTPVTNTVVGAMEIQETAERAEWIGEAGSPAAYAPHLRKAPLAGVTPKSILLLIAKCDQTAPNPTTTAIVRAGDLADRTLWYRHDLYYPACGGLANPHSFPLALENAAFRPLALAAQDTAGKFFASDGGPVSVTDPRQLSQCAAALPPLFEFPMSLLPELPEGLNFVK